MGDKLFAVVLKRKTLVKTKTGRSRVSWVREYRPPTVADADSEIIDNFYSEKLDTWAALGVLPNEEIDAISNYDRGHRLYGMKYWKDMFSKRQLIGHCLFVETFFELHRKDLDRNNMDELHKAAYVYLSFVLSKLVNWNARYSSWNINAGTMRSVFDRHDFSFKWSYAEMPFFITGSGVAWAGGQIKDSLEGIIDLLPPDDDLLHKATELRVVYFLRGWF